MPKAIALAPATVRIFFSLLSLGEQTLFRSVVGDPLITVVERWAGIGIYELSWEVGMVGGARI